MKYWELLLIKQRERGKDGLTVPFLIGSQNYLPEKHFKQDIEALVVDIVSSNTFETCIRYCMGTQAFIFEIRNPKNSVYFPTYNNSNQSNLSVAVFSKNDFGESINSLVGFLIDNYKDKIDTGNFSAVPNIYERTAKWTAFTVDEDIPFIEETLKHL